MLGDPSFVFSSFARFRIFTSNLVDETSIDVNWRHSFYLNLIAHTSFSVTVAICSHQDLLNHRARQDTPLSPIYKVVNTVYASPSRVNFQLDPEKEVETTPAYPDICFAIDDFDSTFDVVVLTEKDHCYCVVLNAHDGAAFPSEKVANDCSTSDSSSLPVHSSSAKKRNTKLTLLSGFVSYQMVRDAYDAGRSQFGSLLSVGHSSGKTDRIYMKGPGGRGEVEVVVSSVAEVAMEAAIAGGISVLEIVVSTAGSIATGEGASYNGPRACSLNS
ncbi:uncharacterized protein LOC114375409 [Glycine soja]|uniref:uncharacterized protein LOC114375409 n=1 Tax=Glycine soja TaxID=3848 RepID=UPI00103E75B8|nr:uncharacterized protein LOC114375409 [Glycine soja]